MDAGLILYFIQVLPLSVASGKQIAFNINRSGWVGACGLWFIL